MKKRITLIITASILVLALGSFIGVQAYQYYVPHGYIVSDKIVHNPKCTAINQNNKDVTSDSDFFINSYFESKWSICPVCNPKKPALSEVKLLLDQWKNTDVITDEVYEVNQKLINDVKHSKEQSHSLPLTKGQYYQTTKYSLYKIFIDTGTFKPYEEETDYNKEEYYLLSLLKEKGYSYNTYDEAIKTHSKAVNENLEKDYNSNAIQAAENYLNQRKNIFYFFNK